MRNHIFFIINAGKKRPHTTTNTYLNIILMEVNAQQNEHPNITHQ